MANEEQFILDGLAINDGTNFRMLVLEAPPAPLRQRWIEGDDADGAVLAEPSKRGNRVWTLTVQVVPQTTTDLFLAKIGQIVDKLYEAEQQADQGGLAGTWTPAAGTKTGTLYVLSGEILGLPVTFDDGWFARAPTIQIRLDARPFLYGTEVISAATVTNSLPYQVLTVANVTGDVPAEARLVVTDGATQSRRHLEWGAAWRYTPPSALLDSDNLVVSGFAGTQTTLAGAYDSPVSGNNAITATIRAQVQAVCGTGVLAHIGSFRVKARCNVSAVTTRVRLTYQDGDGPFRSNGYATPPTVGWVEMDLGVITISEKTLGTQRWSGRIDAYTTTTGFGGGAGSDTLYVDYLVLIPILEGYGKARAAYSYSAGVLNARDDFSSIAATTVLNARVAPTGGTWATSGAATDLAAADAPTSSEETETRATTSDAAGGRFAILGASNFTDSEIQIGFYRTATPASTFYQGVIMRWTDASNHLRVTSSGGTGFGGIGELRVTKVVAGVVTDLGFVTYPTSTSTWYQIRAVVFASGAGTAWLLDSNGAVLTSLAFQDSAIATGGTLATGKPGFVDYNGSATASTRYYDNFSHSVPAAEPIVVYSGRAAEIRSDQVIRQDSTGVYYGAMPSYRGARFFLRPAGDENRPTTIVAKLRRNDIDEGLDDQVADSTTVTVHYTPRYSTVPR